MFDYLKNDQHPTTETKPTSQDVDIVEAKQRLVTHDVSPLGGRVTFPAKRVNLYPHPTLSLGDATGETCSPYQLRFLRQVTLSTAYLIKSE